MVNLENLFYSAVMFSRQIMKLKMVHLDCLEKYHSLEKYKKKWNFLFSINKLENQFKILPTFLSRRKYLINSAKRYMYMSLD